MAFKFKAVPWLLVLAALRVLYEHWQRVEERDRRRATEIIVRSRGLPHKMAQAERQDLVDIARRLDHMALGRDLADAATPFPVPGLKSKKPGKG
ncbi:MAG TPA: hypothetical protein PKD63_05355 [Solirubrobacteraceae bacterium]|nr:hypothetical protein [Solirubrobacteraceae bacterium]